MTVFYLHGFASSARSAKAAFFSERFAEHGIATRAPDFNQPDFATMTMTRMLDQLEDEIARVESGPVVCIGSSLGAVVAIHAASRPAVRIDRLVLLAPAVMFPRDAGRVLGTERVEEWRRTGSLDVFHYADGASRPLNYAFYEDGMRYDAMTVAIEQPTLVFQGERDEAVDARDVERYARTRRNVTLTLLDDDHRLMASLPRIWTAMTTFLDLA